MSKSLPDVVASASTCIADLFPEGELASWAHPESRERAGETAKRLGVAADRLPELTLWTDEALESGTLRWPGILRAPDDARSLARRFELPTDQLALVGIALPERDVADFLDDNYGTGDPGWVQAIRQHQQLATGGQPLGFEVLGLDGEGFHSWRCNSLEDVAAERLDIMPNQYGLIQTLEDAERVAELANDGQTRAEDCLWLPWLVTRYGWGR
jgi:hypothetical protein